MSLEERIWRVLEEVHDPEMPISIVDLGLVYGVEVSDQEVRIVLTYTETACPALEMIQEDVRQAVRRVAGARSIRLEVTWDPPWTPARLTERGRKLLRMWGLSV